MIVKPRPSRENRTLTVYPVAGEDAFRVIMFDFSHLRDQVGYVDQFCRSVPSRDYQLCPGMSSRNRRQYSSIESNS